MASIYRWKLQLQNEGGTTCKEPVEKRKRGGNETITAVNLQ